MTEWTKPPRPVLGWTLHAVTIFVRLWALPFALLGWLAGVIVWMTVLGYEVGWECYLGKRAQRLRLGVQEPQPIDEQRWTLRPFDINDHVDDDEWSEDDEGQA